MMLVGGGQRDEWEFEYTAAKLAIGAKGQKEHRESRVAFWREAYAKAMQEIKDQGLEVTESDAVAAMSYSNTRVMGPQINVRHDLQKKLAEAHQKIGEHRDAAAQYDGWIQVLEANPESRLKLTHADWLYFFGKA